MNFPNQNHVFNEVFSCNAPLNHQTRVQNFSWVPLIFPYCVVDVVFLRRWRLSPTPVNIIYLIYDIMVRICGNGWLRTLLRSPDQRLPGVTEKIVGKIFSEDGRPWDRTRASWVWVKRSIRAANFIGHPYCAIRTKRRDLRTLCRRSQ